MRFIEETWSSEKLGNLCKITMGQSPSSKNYSKNSNDTILIQGNADLISGKIVPRIYTSEITKLSYPGDIILTVRAPVGDLAINEFDSCIGRGVCSIKGNKFIYYYLESLKDKHVWERLSQGSTFESVNSNDIKNLNLKIPSNSTQNHIINFFTAIDTKIELLQKKHGEYIRFKQYLMQNIFADKSAEKLRFKNDKQWNVYLLRNFINEYNERMGNKSNLPILSSTLNGIFLQNEYFNKSVSSKDVKNYKIVPNGYFTYRSMSDTGKFRFNIQSIVEVGIISPAYPVFSTQNIDDYFLYYYLNNSNFIKKQILSLKEGGTRYALSFSKFKKLKISLPSLEEQKKIANFLSAVDKKIDLIQTQIQKMEEFKKGLLQQMFV